MNFKEIIEGWRNHLIPPSDLKDLIKEVSNHRLDICKECPFQSDNFKRDGGTATLRLDLHCVKCGCPLITKTKSLSSACPMSKWEALTNDEDRYHIEEQIKKENENNTLQ